jgi:dGTPase
MREYGGFDHNEQSLRVVTWLEESYPQHSGLNLSYEVLEGLQKHRQTFTHPQGMVSPSPSLEAQIANVADEIAYYSHDLEDGLESGLLPAEGLSVLELWREATEQAEQEASGTLAATGPRTHRKFILRCLINREVEDLVSTSRKAIAEAGVTSVAEVRLHPSRLISYSAQLKPRNAALRRHLFENFYRHPEVNQANENACLMMEHLFQDLLQHPHHLGSRSLARVEREGLPRVVSDYIAGMTDSYLRSRMHSLQEQML